MPDTTAFTLSLGTPGRARLRLSATYIACVIGAILTGVSFQMVRNSEERALQTEFERLSVERAAVIQRNFATFADIVGAIRMLYYSADGMTRDEFGVLAAPLMQHHPGIQALEWAPRVRGRGRDRLEVSARRDGLENFQITERSPEGLLPRSRQEEYFPITYVEPIAGNEDALGYDLASDPCRKRALEESRDTGKATATSRIRLVQEGGDSYGFLIALPVYSKPSKDLTPKQRTDRLQGFVLGVYDAADVLAASLAGFSHKGIDVQLCDLSAPEDDQLLGVWKNGAYSNSGMIDVITRGAILYRHAVHFDLAGRSWEVAAAATPTFFEDRITSLPWVVLVAGLALTVLTSVYFYRIADRSRKLSESESRYRAMAEATPDAIVVLDPVGDRFVDANQNACELFGCTREELLKVGPADLSPELQADGTSSRDSASGVISRVFNGEIPVFEWLHRDSKGNVFPTEIKLAPFPYRDGRTLVLGRITDITERRKTSEERRILEQKLQEAQKLESLGLLTSGIAHDFNNLLTPILGRAGLALDEIPVGGSGRSHVEDIRISAIRAEEIIHQLLTFTGQATMETSKICLNTAVREMGRLWEVSLPESVTLDYAFAVGDPVIEGDAGQIRQAILNLITNAADAVSEGGGAIRVATGEAVLQDEQLATFFGGTDLHAGNFAWLEVADTGSGMNRETEVRVFDPFFTTKEPGRGLGLATVLGIVKTHGGAISVRSRPGKGTIFKAVFPGALGPADVPVPPPAAVSGKGGEGVILVVDDEKRIRDLIAAILAREGFETLTAKDGPTALETFREHADRIRLVLMDQTMPGLSGVGVFAQIHEISPDLPVILMSGYGERTMLEQVSGQGLAGFLQKPFEPKRLLESVHKALELV